MKKKVPKQIGENRVPLILLIFDYRDGSPKKIEREIKSGKIRDIRKKTKNKKKQKKEKKRKKEKKGKKKSPEENQKNEKIHVTP
jgi:hypothetical protein